MDRPLETEPRNHHLVAGAGAPLLCGISVVSVPTEFTAITDRGYSKPMPRVFVAVLWPRSACTP